MNINSCCEVGVSSSSVGRLLLELQFVVELKVSAVFFSVFNPVFIFEDRQRIYKYNPW